MSLLILGLSHKTAPLAVREKLAFDTEQLDSALGDLKGHKGIAESMILSTCNRTELYCNAEPEAALSARDWLQRHGEIVDLELAPHLYQLSDEQAVRHVLRVASGLDSMVVGEPQILGQLKQAYRSAVEAGTIGKLLNRLMQFSFSTAKLIRTDTDIGATPVSVAYAAVKLAQQIHGSLDQKTALLIGAGETVSLVASHLSSAGVKKFFIANRSFDKARELAEKYNGTALTLTDLPRHLAEGDIVVSSTASRLPIVTAGVVDLALEQRYQEPMFFVDLAVPRDIDSAVAEIDDVYLYTVDDLEQVVASNMQLRSEAAVQAEEMVQLQVDGYMEWLKVQSSSTIIGAYREQGAAIRDATVEQALRRLAAGDEPGQVIEQLAHTLTNKLMHQPTTALRGVSDEDDFLVHARKLLGLDETKHRP